MSSSSSGPPRRTRTGTGGSGTGLSRANGKTAGISVIKPSITDLSPVLPANMANMALCLRRLSPIIARQMKADTEQRQ